LDFDPMTNHVFLTLTVPLATAAELCHSRSAGIAAKTSTVQPGKTAGMENVLDFDPMATAVFLTQTVPLATAVVSRQQKSAGNAAQTRTVQPGKTARTKNVLQVDPMAAAVFPTLTVLLATAVVSGPSRNVENAARPPTARLDHALRGPAELFCPKGPSARRTQTASLDVVLEKVSSRQVAHALA